MLVNNFSICEVHLPKTIKIANTANPLSVIPGVYKANRYNIPVEISKTAVNYIALELSTSGEFQCQHSGPIMFQLFIVGLLKVEKPIFTPQSGLNRKTIPTSAYLAR